MSGSDVPVALLIRLSENRSLHLLDNEGQLNTANKRYSYQQLANSCRVRKSIVYEFPKRDFHKWRWRTEQSRGQANDFGLIATRRVGFRIATYPSLKVEVRLLTKFPSEDRIVIKSKDYCMFELFRLFDQNGLVWNKHNSFWVLPIRLLRSCRPYC